MTEEEYFEHAEVKLAQKRIAGIHWKCGSTSTDCFPRSFVSKLFCGLIAVSWTASHTANPSESGPRNEQRGAADRET